MIQKTFISIVGLLTLFSFMTHAADSSDKELKSMRDNGYLVFKTSEGDFTYKIDGRIMIDHAAVISKSDNVKNDQHSYVNNGLRRARLSFKTIFYKDWTGEFDFDIDDGAAKYKDMWLGYKLNSNINFIFGNHKPAQVVDSMVSSRHHSFMEASPTSEAFGLGRRIGLSAIGSYDKFYGHVSLYGDEASIKREDSTKKERFGYSGRFVARHLPSHYKVSAGISYFKILPEPDGTDSELQLKADYPMDPYDGTGKNAKYKFGNEAKEADIMSVELIFLMNKFSFQTEYMMAKVKLQEDQTQSDPNFKAFYAQVTYTLFGGNRSYDRGSSELLKINSDKDSLELAFRMGTTDLTDEDYDNTSGEKMTDYTLGLNYFVNKNISFMANYVNGKVKVVGGEDEKVQTFGIRAALLF